MIILLVLQNQKLKRIGNQEITTSEIDLDQIYNIDLTGAPFQGDRDAPVKIVVFSDFFCVYCKQAALSLEELQQENPGKIVVFYKHFPNPADERSFSAALASMAADKQVMFWEMHNLLLFSDESIDRNSYKNHVELLGLDSEMFQNDLQSSTLKERVERDLEQAISLEIHDVPTLFINGLRITTAEKAKINHVINMTYPAFKE